MAWVQSTRVPASAMQTMSIGDFSGGLNNRSTVLETHQCSDVLNMRYADATVMEKRFGTKLYEGTHNVLSSPVTKLDMFYPFKDKEMVVHSEKGSINFDTVKFPLTGTEQVQGVNYSGGYLFVDGAKMYHYNKFPQKADTYTILTGTPVDAFVLFEVVAPPTTFTPLAEPHKVGKTVYNYTAKTVHYEPCKYETEDAYKGANVPPKLTNHIAHLKGRLYVSGQDDDDDNIFITDIGNPYYFPVAMPIQLPPNSDNVRILIPFDDSIVVGRKNDMYMINGITNNPTNGLPMFKLVKLNTHTGVMNADTCNAVHNYLFFMGDDGNAYGLLPVRGLDVTSIASSIISKTVDIFKAPINFTRSEYASAKSFFIDDLWYVSLGSKMMVYSYVHQSWTLYDGLDVTSFTSYNGQLLMGTKAGRIIQFDENKRIDWNNKPYLSFWTSSWMDFGDPNSFKHLRDFYIVAHTYNDVDSEIRLSFEIDYGLVSNELVIQDVIAKWGKSRFGERFINRNINASLPITIGQRGRQMRFTFTNGFRISKEVATIDDLDTSTNMRYDDLVRITSTGQYYRWTREFAWALVRDDELSQPMRVYQVNGDFELRGKR